MILIFTVVNLKILKNMWNHFLILSFVDSFHGKFKNIYNSWEKVNSDCFFSSSQKPAYEKKSEACSIFNKALRSGLVKKLKISENLWSHIAQGE